MHRLIVFSAILLVNIGCRIYHKEPIELETALAFDIEWLKLTAVDSTKYECYKIDLKNDTVYAYKPGYYKVHIYKIPKRDIVKTQVINRKKSENINGLLSSIYDVYYYWIW